MKRLDFRSLRLWRSFLAILTIVAVAGVAPTAASASVAQKKKLSMSSVTVANGPNASSGPMFVALYSGFYKKYGLNVTWVNTTAGAIASVTVLLAGSAQFTSDGANAQIQAVQNGAPIRALMQIGAGGPQEIDLTQAAASAHGISTQANTPAEALAQFMQLKGSHLKIAISSTTSNAYAWFVGAAVTHGITYGINCATCDVNVQSVGSVPNEVTAFQAGKADGLINIPPYTNQPGGVVMPFYKITPLGPKVIVNYIATTISMVQQHPDTVQAFVNAIYASVLYTKTNPKASEKDLNYMFSQTGVTDVPTEQGLWTLNTPFWQGLNPYPTKAAFNNTVQVFNLSLKTPFAVPYSTYVVTKFAKAASKIFHLSSAG